MAGVTLSRHSKESIFGQGFGGSLAAAGAGWVPTIPITAMSNKSISVEVVTAKDGAGMPCTMHQGGRGCVWHARCAHNVLAMA